MPAPGTYPAKDSDAAAGFSADLSDLDSALPTPMDTDQDSFADELPEPDLDAFDEELGAGSDLPVPDRMS